MLTVRATSFDLNAVSSDFVNCCHVEQVTSQDWTGDPLADDADMYPISDLLDGSGTPLPPTDCGLNVDLALSVR